MIIDLRYTHWGKNALIYLLLICLLVPSYIGKKKIDNRRERNYKI